ncbi:MAG: DUF262 domain-containing protein [Pseudomonadota bacterium]
MRQKSLTEEEGPELELSEPFDPLSISIETKNLLVQTIVNRLAQGTIRLAPKFQREEVWKEPQKSRLIESILLKIPLPMFYVASDERANYDVVDGMQRLSALRDFIFENGDVTKEPNGKGDALGGLEFIPSLNGKRFCDLDIFYKNRIMETELSFTIINPGTPEDVKFTIFSRVNTGGLALTEQEVRHALYNGPATDLLCRIVTSDAFQLATDGKLDSSRMEDREVALRALAFMVRSPLSFPKKGIMSEYLSDTMLIINAMPTFDSIRYQKWYASEEACCEYKITDIDTLEHRFIEGVSRAYALFEDHAFRKSLPGGKKQRINKSLLETWVCVLSELSPVEYEGLVRDKDRLHELYAEVILDKEFNDATTRYALYPESIGKRYSIVENLVQETLKGWL